MRYAFIKAQSNELPVSRLCKWLDVHPSGDYGWNVKPRSTRSVENERITGLIKQFWLESGGVYGCRKIHSDLRDYGESCSANRVHRLMRCAGLKAQVGYRRPRHKSGKVSIVAPNHLQRKFNVTTPNETWVTDITYIRTHKLVIFSGGVGLVLSQSHWLVNAAKNNEKIGVGCFIDGGMATKTKFNGHCAFRSRLSIY